MIVSFYLVNYMIHIFILSIKENWTIVHPFSSDTVPLIASNCICNSFPKEPLGEHGNEDSLNDKSSNRLKGCNSKLRITWTQEGFRKDPSMEGCDTGQDSIKK